MNPRPLEEVFSELIRALEDDSAFEIEGFLTLHAEQAPVLRERIEKLRRAGLLGAGDASVARLRDMRERFGVATAADVVAPPPERGELLPSRVVGSRYRVTAEIGRGGMGRVFRARDVDLGRDVALKVIDLSTTGGPNSPRHRALVARFLAEARVTAQLEHPSVVPLHDIGVDRTSELYYTMKLVEGRTLASLISDWHADRAAGRTIPTTELVRIVLQICDALALAHEHGVIHRDLKPSNVMVGRFGEVYVMDWGLAKSPGAPAPAGTLDHVTADERATRSGDVIGTPSHMAPEQAAGAACSVDARADVYGVGAIMHNALLGVPPNRPVPGSSGRDLSRIPKPLRAIMCRALARDPVARYATVGALASDLRAFLTDAQGVAWHDPTVVRVAKLVRRHPTRAAVVVAVAVLVPLALFGWKQRTLRNVEAARRADREQALAVLERQRFDEDTVARLHELRERHGFETSTGPIDQLGAAEQFLQTFAERLVRIDDRRPVSEVAADLTSACDRSPALRRTVVDSLYDLALILFTTRVAHGAWLAERAELPNLDEKALRAAREVAAARADLVSLWERLDPLIEACEDDPWRLDTWRDWTAVCNGDESPVLMTARVDEAEASGRSAAQLVHLGVLAHTSLGDAAAERLYQLAETDEPGLFWPHFALGSIAFRRRDATEMLRQFELTRVLNPGFGRVHSNLCAAYCDLDRIPEALAAGRKAVELVPNSSRARANFGLALQRSGDNEAAEEQLRTALALEPGYLNAWHILGQTLYAGGRYAEATALCRQALEIDPSAVEILRLDGFVWQNRAEGELAHRAYAQAASLDPGFLPIWVQMLEGTWWLERAVALGSTCSAHADPAVRADLTGKVVALLHPHEPVDTKERVWFAAARLFRGEYLDSARLWEPLVTELMSAENPRAAALADGQEVTVVAWWACLAAARAATGRGYSFVEGRALLEPSDPGVSTTDGRTLPRICTAERPTLAAFLAARPQDGQGLPELTASCLELWIEAMGFDAESADPLVAGALRLAALRQVLSEPSLRDLRTQGRIAKAITEIERWEGELAAARATPP